MGVRGLRTYLKCYCPNACYKVLLPDLISKEWRESKCQPVIVVDAVSCYSMWCRGINWTIGLEVQELIYRLQSFVEAFDDMGAHLVFFVAGLTPQKKRKTWRRRRITDIHNMSNVYDLLYANKTYEDIPEPLDSIPPNMESFVAFVLKHVLNCEVHVSVGDCDEEIINYVHENDSFAIFAFDTDFVVSLVHCIVLDADTYDCDKKTAILYDPEVLCKYLRLEEDQLPLFAILAGNDLIDYEILEPFHCKISNWSSKTSQIPYKLLMESIAGYINSLPRRTRLSSKMMERICVDVFGDSCRADDMMVAYKTYIPGPTSDITANDPWSRVLRMAKKRLQSVLLPVSAWGVLSEQVYESSVCFEDLRETNDCNDDIRNCPSATITRRLRKRFYGVLLYEKRDSRLTVKEWCAENTESYRRPVEVKPEYPKIYHPGLRALWTADPERPYYRKKWRLFLSVISPCIANIADWMSLPDYLVVSTAACYYLYYEKHFLEKWELDAILMTVALFSFYGRFFLNAVRQVKEPQSFRAIRISITFSRTYSLVFSLMASCGFPVPLSKDTAYIKFEPVLFHMIYEQVRKRASLEQICNNNERVLETFCKMESTIRDSAP